MRLIDAEELFNKVGKIVPRNITHYKAIGEFMNMITNSPTIQPKQGEWIEVSTIGYECSVCHYGVQPWNNTNFCPNCGTRMKGADDEMR